MKKVIYPLAIALAILTVIPQMDLFAAKHVVNVQNFSFSPANISNVQLGDTIRWVWVSGTHTTTSSTIPGGAASWNSPITSSVTSFEYKVIVAGTFNYVCTPHAGGGMVGSFTAVAAVLPGPAGPISGPSTVCKNTNGSFSVATITGATSYVWTVPTGATITAGQGTSSITANFGPSSVSGNVSVYGTNGAGNGTPGNLAVTVSAVPAQPSVIAGSSSPCTGSSQVYSVTNVSGVVYNWTIPSGSTITAGQGTSSITATMGTTSGNINVIPSNGCGGGVEQIKAISIQLLPGTAGAVSGPTLVDLATIVTTDYTTPGASDATSYQWELSPAGAGTLSGTGLTSTVTWTGSFLGVAQVRVKAINTCGEGEWSEVKSTEVINTTGIADLNSARGMKVYPSPSSGAFTVAVNGFNGQAKLRILDTTGHELYTASLPGNEATQFEFPLSSGIYVLLVEEGTQTLRQKLIIR